MGDRCYVTITFLPSSFAAGEAALDCAGFDIDDLSPHTLECFDGYYPEDELTQLAADGHVFYGIHTTGYGFTGGRFLGTGTALLSWPSDGLANGYVLYDPLDSAEVADLLAFIAAETTARARVETPNATPAAA